jgi:ankyrin repeat protein
MVLRDYCSLTVSHSFGWIFRRLDTLRGSLNVPEEVGTPLDETFEEALHGIPKEKYPDAFRLFQCLVAAPRSRPLELKEIVDIFSTYPDAAPSEEAVLAACPALVAIEEQDSKKIVRFSHRPESVIADFLTSKRLRDLKPKTISETDKSDISRYHFSLEDANATLSQACIKVLLQFDEMSKKEDLKYSPLALYAAQRWVEHTQFGKVASKNLEVMKSLLDPNESHLEAWIWMHDVDKGRSRTVDELALRPPLRNARKAAPLYYAALCGFSELVTFLATTYGDLNNERGYHGTPLHAASYKGHLDAVRALIDRGANPDAAIRNKTPLHAAYFGGRLATMELLLNMGAKVNETGASDKDETPGASGKDTKGASGNTVLHYASLDGRLDVIEVLFVRNADINAKNPNGWTPLHGAALRGQVDVARRLLKEVTKRLQEREDDPGPLRQEDVLNARSRNGNTPLHVAAIAGKLEVVDLLLKKKAKTDLAGEYGWTPVQAAEENRHDEIARLLGRGDLRRFVGSVSNQVSNRVSSTVSSTLRPLRQIHL